MPLELANTIWNELKRYIPQTDRSEAADAFVMAMIDDDIDAEDIRNAFKSDSEIKAALQSYLDDTETWDDEEEDWDEEEEEDY